MLNTLLSVAEYNYSYRSFEFQVVSLILRLRVVRGNPPSCWLRCLHDLNNPGFLGDSYS